jgi:hypothetical protein
MWIRRRIPINDVSAADAEFPNCATNKEPADGECQEQDEVEYRAHHAADDDLVVAKDGAEQGQDDKKGELE